MGLLESPPVDEIIVKVIKSVKMPWNLLKSTSGWVPYLVLKQDEFIVMAKDRRVQQSGQIYPKSSYI